MLQSLSIETQAPSAEHLKPLHPVGAVAATIARRICAKGSRPVLYLAENSRRARAITEVLAALIERQEVVLFPRWDGFVEDGIEGSIPIVGARMAVLRRHYRKSTRPAATVTTAAALMRKVPPRKAMKDASIPIKVGEAIDVDGIRKALVQIGYRFDERCDEPGEAAIHGHVVEIYAAAAEQPCRVEHRDGTIIAIRFFDAVTQRSVGEADELIIDPASETLAANDPSPSSIVAHYGTADTFFDYAPDCDIVVEADIERSAERFGASLEDGRTAGTADFLTVDEWNRAVAERLSATVEDDRKNIAAVPNFAREHDPLAALADFVEPFRKKKYRLVLAGPAGSSLRLWSRRISRALEASVERIGSWNEAKNAEPSTLLRLDADIFEGFVAQEDEIVLVTLRELEGQGAAALQAKGDEVLRTRESIFPGDAVVHFDHGVGVLEGLETVGEGETKREALRLRFAEDATLLVPMDEIGALWRYGGSEADISLDRLKGDAWVAKRNRIVEEITRTAETLVGRLKEKEAAKAKVIQPDRVRYERFCERFRHEPTSGQYAAIEAVLTDLKSGHPMDRLLCGDVGFGKTEIAMRAAAAAVYAGRQVAIVAPTTVLARQHFESFRKRFSRDEVSVALLSRLQSPAEAKETKARLADGSVQVLVATHAVCGKDVAFDDLALVVIDEEHRFGSRHKDAIRKLADGLHVLSMTATPIPRTLQAGFVGLHDLSIIATPPVRRRPIRTSVEAFGDETVRDALLTERSQGGQSFFVCPRIEDIEPMGERIAKIAPELSIVALHGKMSPADVDRTMVEFSSGEGDVLLATNIIESGIDVPAANTMIIYRPELFGLAQLHQLRGRVGRGSRRGCALLLTDGETNLSETAETRLATLERSTALGSGFDIAAQDLDLRGAGELMGEEQAGHLQLIGLSLYRRTLERALAVARGEKPADEWQCDVNIGLTGSIPSSHIPEPELRIEIAATLDAIRSESALDAMRDDLTDRFGPMPAELSAIFDLASVRLRATALGIRRLDAGPKAVAAIFSRDDADELSKRLKPEQGDVFRWMETKLVLDRATTSMEERLNGVEQLFDLVA